MTKNNQWSDQHQKKYIWLYNYLKTKKPDIKYENYLDKHNKRDLVSLIKNNEDWSSSSKESIYFMMLDGC